jgi:hypothetical protein
MSWRQAITFLGNDWKAQVYFDTAPHNAFPDIFSADEYKYTNLLAQYGGTMVAARGQTFASGLSEIPTISSCRFSWKPKTRQRIPNMHGTASIKCLGTWLILRISGLPGERSVDQKRH